MSLGIGSVTGSRAGERLGRGRGVGGAHCRGWIRVLPGNSTGLRLAAFLCCVFGAFRQIPVAPSGASLLCLTAHPCRAFGASLPFSPGKVVVVRVAEGSGVALGVGAWWACGQGSAGSLAGEQAGPTAGDRFGIFRGILPCFAFRRFPVCRAGRSRPCFPALPGCAPGRSMLRLRRFPAFRSGEGGGGAERWGVRVGFGGRGFAGSRAWEHLRRGVGVGGARGRGPRLGMGSEFFGTFNHSTPCGVLLLGLPANPGRAFQRFPAVPYGRSLPLFRRFPAVGWLGWEIG